MAISCMQKVSLVFPKELLDDLLLEIQQLRRVEIRDLATEASWSEAFTDEQLAFLEVGSDQETLASLSKRQQKLKQAIDQLKTYLPKQSLLTRLRQKRHLRRYSEVEAYGQASLEGDSLKKVESLFREHDHLQETLRKLTVKRDAIANWKDLTISPDSLNQNKHVKALVGTLPNTDDNRYLRRLQEADGVDYQEIFCSETEYGVILFLHPRATGTRPIDLASFHFKDLDYPYSLPPAEQLQEMALAERLLMERLTEIDLELKKENSFLESLEVELEWVTNRHAREAAKKYLVSSPHLVALEGWIERAEVSLLKKSLCSQFGETLLMVESEVVEEDWPSVPIKLTNHPLIEPFEMITEMYALPRYYEKDPTPYLAPFYVLFFGMMVADVGYGLLITLLTGLALRCFTLSTSIKRFLKFFKVLGLSVAVWGFLYGSFFSFDLPIRLLSTTDDVMTILMLSVAFGLLTVLVGLFLSGHQKMRMRSYAEAYHFGFAWLFILLGLVFVITGKLLPDMAILVAIGQWLALLNVLGILVASVIAAKSLKGLGSGLYNLYNATGYVSDLVSFTRLMALGVSGASIGAAFNMIVGMLPMGFRFTIGIFLFMALHAINLGLSLLSAYVHGARLIFVEFFGKFYEGGGRAFNPLKPAEKYFDIKNVDLEDN